MKDHLCSDTYIHVNSDYIPLTAQMNCSLMNLMPLVSKGFSWKYTEKVSNMIKSFPVLHALKILSNQKFVQLAHIVVFSFYELIRPFYIYPAKHGCTYQPTPIANSLFQQREDNAMSPLLGILLTQRSPS